MMSQKEFACVKEMISFLNPIIMVENTFKLYMNLIMESFRSNTTHDLAP